MNDTLTDSLQPLVAAARQRMSLRLGELRAHYEAHPQTAWLNTLDAAARGISNGDEVFVYNDRGTVKLQARVTERIMPGVVSIPQGAWWKPGEDGIDRRGCVNVLSRYEPTPLAFGNPTHTILVQVEKAEADR